MDQFKEEDIPFKDAKENNKGQTKKIIRDRPRFSYSIRHIFHLSR